MEYIKMDLQNRFLDKCAHIALRALGKIETCCRDQTPFSFPDKNLFKFLSRLEVLEKKVSTLEQEKKSAFSKKEETDTALS